MVILISVSLRHLSSTLSLELIRLRSIYFFIYIEVFIREIVSGIQTLSVVEESIHDVEKLTYPAPTGIFMSVPRAMSFGLPSYSTKKLSKSSSIRFPSFSSSNVNIEIVSFSSNNISPPIRIGRQMVCR